MRLLGTVTLGLACVVVARLEAREVPGSFSLEATKRQGQERDFVRDWAAARRKWGKPVPQAAFSMLSSAVGDVVVDPLAGDDIYIADVKVGNCPQIVKLALDTGSSDLWMESTDTNYRINRDGPWGSIFKPNASRTAIPVAGARWTAKHVDGNGTSGSVYRDTVRLGDLKFDNVTVQSAHTVPPLFEKETELSGVMGLAKDLPSGVVPPSPSFVRSSLRQLESPVFSADLGRNASGRFVFGRVSPPQENVTWLDAVPDSGYWDVDLDQTGWRGRLGTWHRLEYRARVDTGTALLFLPDDLAGLYWFDIPGMRVDPRLDDAFTFPCDLADNLPDLYFKLPGTEHVLTVPGEYLNYGPVMDGSGDGYCWGGMQATRGLDVAVMGNVMLKAVFVAFDVGNGRVGFANKRLDQVE